MKELGRQPLSDTRIAEFVLPLVEVQSHRRRGLVYAGLRGTGFFIGELGMTAAHVTDPGTDELRALSVTASGEWSSHEITVVSTHSSEDVCLFRLEDEHKSSASPMFRRAPGRGLPPRSWHGVTRETSRRKWWLTARSGPVRIFVSRGLRTQTHLRP